MPRIIDADKLKAHYAWWNNEQKELFDQIVDLQPTVDAEPVKHGHWIKERNPMMYQLSPYVWVCDQCGTAFYYNTPYCGECGARMDEEDVR